MVKAAFYARYSSSAQRAESIEGQRRICADYAEKHGLHIIAEYVDEALTGTNDKRPSFQRMIKDAERGRFEALVVYSVDRFARNQYDSAIYEHRLESAGVRIHYATQAFGDAPESVILYSVMKGYAEYYSKNLAVQVKRGMTENALKARWNARPPLGYVKDADMRLVPDPLTSATVRYIFERYAEGDSAPAIVRALNARGLRNAFGKPFTRNSLQGLLHNAVYIGVYKWGDITVEDAHPAIVPRETFEKVQAMLSKHKKTPAHSADFILSGKAVCGLCGAPLIGESGKSHTGVVHYYYTCQQHKRKTTAEGKCPKRPEKREELEAVVLRCCLDLLTPERIHSVAQIVAELMEKQARENDITPAIRENIAALDKKINNILDAMEQGIFTPSTRARLDDLEKQKADAEKQLAEAAAPAPVLTASQIEFYLYRLAHGDTHSREYQLSLVDTLLNSVAVYDGEDKKIALAFNLSANACQTLSGSDLLTMVHQHNQKPNGVPFLINSVLFGVICRVYHPPAIKNQLAR